MGKDLKELYYFIKNNSGYIVGECAKNALAMAKRLEVALQLGFNIKWEHEEYVEICDLGDYETEETFKRWLNNGEMEVLCLTVESEEFTDSLGYITVKTSYSGTEDYKRMCELELIDQVYLQTLKGS